MKYEEMRNDPATMAVFRALRTALAYIALCALAIGAGSLTWLMFLVVVGDSHP